MKTEAERQLAKLVSMPTITEDTHANELALDYIEQYLAGHGLHTKRFNLEGYGALVATVRPDAKRPKVFLYSHVDVVAGEAELFTLREQGDRLMGRGTYDMKFAIAAYMQLVHDLKYSLDDYDFGIMITTDEEYGGRDGISGALRLLEKGYGSSVCIVPDGGTDWNLESLAKGKWRFDLVADGRTAHGARPWEGESASFKLIQALHALKGRFKNHGPLTDTLNIGLIRGGESFNQIPSSMCAWVEIRLTDKDSVAKNQALLDDICKAYGVRVKTRVIDPPLIHDLSLPLIESFADSVEDIRGTRPNDCLSYGTSDAVNFMAYNIPCIVTRPTGGNLHGPDEWVDRVSFNQLVPVLKDYLDKEALANPRVRQKTAAVV
jgi:succinyl-diaminopimelate desuccinylase